VVIPVTFYHYVACGAHFERFDQVVVHVSVHTGLLESVYRRSRGTTRDEPGFDVAHRGVRELAQRPEPVCVATNQVRTRIAVALAVYKQHGLTDLGLQGAVAGQRANLSIEHHMRGDQS